MKFFPIEKIECAIDSVSSELNKSNRIDYVPAHLFAYLIIASSVFPDLSQTEIFRRLYCCYEEFYFLQNMNISISTDIFRAKRELGYEFVRKLSQTDVVPIANFQHAEKSIRKGYYKNWHLITLDTGQILVPDTSANHTMFNLKQIGEKPQGDVCYLEFVTLIENISKIMFGSQPIGSQKDKIETLLNIKQYLSDDMLCISSQKTFIPEAWEPLSLNASLLWQIHSNTKMKIMKRYPDSSSLSYIYANQNDMKRGRNRIPVRLIKYKIIQGQQDLDVHKRSQVKLKLITSILDYKQAPAVDLVKIYLKRAKWNNILEFYNDYCIKDQFSFRSKSPDLIFQEFYGFLLANYTIRRCFFEAFYNIDESATATMSSNDSVIICT